MLCVVNIGPARRPQYSYYGTSGYGDWRGDNTPRQTYRPPPAHNQYTAGLSEEEQIAEATRQSLRNGKHCQSTVSFSAVLVIVQSRAVSLTNITLDNNVVLSIFSKSMPVGFCLYFLL